MSKYIDLFKIIEKETLLNAIKSANLLMFSDAKKH